MDFDLFFALGLCICALSVPAVLSAISNSRAPRFAAFTLVVGGALVGYAVFQNPGVYTLAGTPAVFVDVLSRWVD